MNLVNLSTLLVIFKVASTSQTVNQCHCPPSVSLYSFALETVHSFTSGFTMFYLFIFVAAGTYALESESKFCVYVLDSNDISCMCLL